MSTSRNFQAMLNEYLPNDLLKEEFVKRDYILSTVEKPDDWMGGKLIVPFKGQSASSIRMGALTAASDIANYKYLRGSVDDYVEAWGSLKFHSRDLLDHSGKVKEDSFLKILPDQIDEFMNYMKMIVSVQLGTGPHLATLTTSGTVGGVIVVDHIDRFELDQKITLKDGNTAAADYYVIAINVNSSEVTVSATRGGAAADVSAYTTGQAAKVYTDDADTTSFSSLRSALLSAANGGSSSLYGVSKLAYPYLQAVNVDGSSISASNILSKLFDAFTEVRQKAKGGKADTFLMNYKNGGSIMKLIEDKANGAANWQISVADRKASLYGWDEITITTVKGTLTVVMIQEWDQDVIVMLDKSAVKFYSNGLFRKQKTPDGLEFYTVRNETGYEFICDISLFGELVVHKPGNCGIIHSIPNY
jgi:hypothetical protein